MIASAARYDTRLLPSAEWPRLAGTEVEALWPHLDPAHASVVVVERDGVIVGTWVVMQLVHIECCWIAPEFRTSGSVARRLLRGMYDAAKTFGARTVLTAALSDDVRALIARLQGQRLPGDHYVVPLPERET